MAANVNFDNKAQWIIRQSIINEGITQAKALLLSVNDGNVVRDQRDLDIDFDTNNFLEDAYFDELKPNLANLVIEPTNFFNETDNAETIPQNPIEIPICKIDYTQKKKVVETHLINQKGSVKEVPFVYSPQITIQGVLVGSYEFPNKEDVIEGKPKKDMEILNELCREALSFNIDSVYLKEVFGVERLIIEEINFPQSNDRYNIQDFIMFCKADSASNKIGLL